MPVKKSVKTKTSKKVVAKPTKSLKKKVVTKVVTAKPPKLEAIPPPPAPKPEQPKKEVLFSGRYVYASGHRKTAIAQVRLYKGSGRVFVNEKSMEEYTRIPTQVEIILSPLELVGKRKIVDISAHVVGGGMSAQAEAIRHGIARALLFHDPELRVTLKRAGFLTRDARVKERKKYGLHRARKGPQWSKR